MAPEPPRGADPKGSGPPDSGILPNSPLGLAAFQRHIEAIYYARDSARGLDGTWLWFSEEVGELARALRRDEPHLSEEFADVLAWLSTLASIKGIDLEEAARAKYGNGCPYCSSTPCACG